MRYRCDNPQIGDIVKEQAEKMPRGPPGMLGQGAVGPIEGMPPDAVPLIIEYLSGQIGTIDFATRAEAIRLRDSIGQASRP